jgi:PKD repeat protein
MIRWLSLLFVIAAVIIDLSIAITSASAQTPQLAYVQISCCPPVSGACDATCSYPNSYLVTPIGGTVGLDDTQPTWSPAAKQIAFTRNNDIFVADAISNSAVNITNTANNLDPAWSPVGTRIAFTTTRDGHSELYLMNPDGSNVVRLTSNVAYSVGHPAWSHDGTRIAFNCQVETGNDDICAINPDGTGFARLTTDSASGSGPAWSPDSQTIAFSSQYGIAVMNPDGSDVRPLGAGVPGIDLAWSPDGAQIAFDDGNYGIDVVPTLYTMKADGTNVTAFVASAWEPAWVPAQVPIATFKFSCTGTDCNFDASNSKDFYGTITSYAWNFGDGMTGAGVSLAHTYAGGGNYTVTLIVTDNSGATGTKIQTITINPVAAFTFSCSVLTCNYDGSGSKDLNATITSYAWKFGDGTTGAGVGITHTYAAGGAYSATLTVTDSTGATSTQSATVNVNAPPISFFTFMCSALTCSFDGSGSRDPDGTITSYTWNFGDGAAGSGATVSHMYAAGGQYAVTLTVTDNGGATATQSNAVTANSPPVASIKFSCKGLKCSFDGSASTDSDGTVTSYVWNFGDGATGSGAMVTHSYAGPGTYTITLTVTDNGGVTGVKSNSVRVPSRS